MSVMGIMNWFKRKPVAIEGDYPVFIPLLKEHLKREEGEKLKPYKCTAGKLTIGVGRNIQDVGISKEESDYLLFNDIEKVVKEARVVFPKFNEWKIGRQVAICSMIFQLGRAGFLGFKTTIRLLREEKWVEASRQAMTSRWATQTPNRAKRVCEMIRTGDAVL